MAFLYAYDEEMQRALCGGGPGLANFFSPYYREHNQARLEHLASLGLPLVNRRVLELGSGPGDHTGFYIERQCAMVAVDARQECLDVLRQRYPEVTTVQCDLNSPEKLLGLGSFDVVHCYGILYHLERPDTSDPVSPSPAALPPSPGAPSGNGV